MSNKHTPPPWYANEHAVYMGADGGFSLRCCPNPDSNAKFIVTAVNYHDRLREALRGALNAKSMEDYHDARALLAELDNLEKQQ